MCTLPVTQQAFTPTGFSYPSTVYETVSTVALPTNGASTPAATKVRITNISGALMFVLLGDDTVTVTPGAGSIVTSNSPIELSIGSYTHIALYVQAAGNTMMIETGY